MPLVSDDSFDTPCLSGQTLTSLVHTTSEHSALYITVKTDRAGTLYIDHSMDGSNWDFVDQYPIIASTAKDVQLPLKCLHFRVRLTNGIIGDQSYLRMQMKVFDFSEVSKAMTVDAASSSVLCYGSDGLENQVLLTDDTGRLQVDVTTLPSLTLDDEVTVAQKAGETFVVSATELDIRPLTLSDQVQALMINTVGVFTQGNLQQTGVNIGSFTNTNRVSCIHVTNLGIETIYFKLYGVANASHSNTPIFVLPVRQSSSETLSLSMPLSIDSAISMRATVDPGNSDQEDPAEDTVIASVFYSGN